MIKNWNNFISENFSKDIHNTLGEYIENLAKEDEFIQMIASDCTRDINPNIRLANAVNLLDDLKRVELLKRVENYLEGKEQDVHIAASIDAKTVKPTEPIQESWGKGVLNTFFKCLTALGFKENVQESKEIPSEFLIFFKFSNLDSSKVSGVFKRFKSLSSIEIDWSQPNISLYFGIKLNGYFEYGYYYDQLVPIGQFKLTKSIYNNLKLSDLKSASGLKQVLVDLNFEDIQILSKIKTEMENFNPGYYEQKMQPQIYGRLITFGYFGVGRWDNGQLDSGELENIKTNLKTFLMKWRWSEKILVNVSPNKFWVYIQIKLK